MPSSECSRQPPEASPSAPATDGVGRLEHLFRHSIQRQQINPLQRIVMRYLQEKLSNPPSQGSGHAD